VDLHWLVSKGYAQLTARAAPAPRANGAARGNGVGKLEKGTRVILTDAGAAAVRNRLTGEDGGGRFHYQAAPEGPSAAGQPVPRWNEARRELWVGDQLVKRYRQPAPDQERILTAFEEEGWPLHIDDPLPPQSGRDSKYRLHDTISNLNRYQQHR